MPRSRVLSPFVLLAAGACSIQMGWTGGNPRCSVSAVETVTLPAAGVARIDGRNELGRIELDAAPGAIVVEARKTARADDEDGARAALAAMRVEARIEGNRAVLQWRWDGARPAAASGWVDFVVSAPAACEAVLATQNGAITVRGRDQRVEATARNGAVVLRECGGPVVATAHNGAIELTGATRDLQLVAHNGGITARLDGDGAVGGTIRTANGGIDLALGPKVQTQVVAGADNGGIRSERPWTDAVAGRTYLVGTQGAAATRLQVQARNGGIAIR